MINITLISFLIFLVVVVLYRLNKRFSRTIKTKSSIDNKYYKVTNVGIPSMELESANALASINEKINVLLNHLKSDNKPFVRRILNNYNPDSLTETSDSILSTFTVNKGERISFCLRCRNCKTKKIEPINILMFVAIHELAHIGNLEEGHGKTFQKLNKYLLEKAVECNAWEYQDYSSDPVGYCNITINSLPK